jgi:hypothetical protein
MAHLTQGDFCLLNEINYINVELTIVNRSSVTLRKPLKYQGVIIHIRGLGELCLYIRRGVDFSSNWKISGTLSGTAYHKRSFSRADHTNKQGFL